MKQFRQDPDYVARQYETIRQEAIESFCDGRQGQGLTLFLTRGMAAWIEALHALAPRSAGIATQDSTIGRLPPAARLDLTSLLADMVLACSRAQEAQ